VDRCELQDMSGRSGAPHDSPSKSKMRILHHPRDVYWEMWSIAMFDLKDTTTIVFEVKARLEAY
jgi:Ribulose bisphosphate carboxylase, small chain